MGRSRIRFPERDAWRALRLQWQRTLLLAGVVGVATGLAVAFFDWVTAKVLLDAVLHRSTAIQVLAPAAGLLVAGLALRYLAGGASPATSDEYIRSFHERTRRMPLGPVLGRAVASVATLGTGGAMGFEGPSIYFGAAIGTVADRMFGRAASRDAMKTLLVAGAAAGVAAIFKAPATGALFALEVPYVQDLAPGAVVPAIVSAATSYLTFVSIQGTAPLFAIRGEPSFDVKDLIGAAAVGLACGLGAHLFVRVVAIAKRAQTRLPRGAAWLVGGAGLALLGWSGVAIFGSALPLGPGYRTVTWLADPSRALGLVALLFAMRLLATAFTIAGGGSGGLFIPLVVQGALLGRFLGGLAGAASTLLPLVGAAAFLGAGYRTPIAAVVFVAESTGRPGFVVPGLIATAIAQLVMGRTSVSAYQERMRGGHVERRLRLTVREAMAPPIAVDPATTVDDLLHREFLQARARALPMLEDGRYAGMVLLADVAEVPREERGTRLARDIVCADVAPAEPGWSLRDAVAEMHRWGIERLAVVDRGALVGVVTLVDIVQMDQVLEATDD